MQINDIKTAFKSRRNVFYNNAEYEIHGISVMLDERTNSTYQSILLKDVKANSFVSVRPEMIKEKKDEEK